MNTLYKSSRFQTYLYFFIYPLLIAISTYFLIGIISYGDFGIFNIVIILTLLYALIVSVESTIALRNIEVTEENIVAKTIFSQNTIDYKDIIYVYNLISFKHTLLIIWYIDTKTNKPKAILVMPERKLISKENFSSLYTSYIEDLAITKYIKERAVKDNPNYLNINNPRWFLFSISPTFKL